MNKTTTNPVYDIQNKILRWLPHRLRVDKNYRAFALHILRRKKYDFFLTVNFRYWRPDVAVMQSTSHLLNVLNRSLSNKSWKHKGRYIEGYGFLERHQKDNDRYGSPHIHILGYFPDTFNAIPVNQDFMSRLVEASTKVTSPKRVEIVKPKEATTKSKKVTDKQEEDATPPKKVIASRGEPMISIGEVDTRIPYDLEGLIRYLSKKLTPENLRNRTLYVGRDGLTGWEPHFDYEMTNIYRPNSLYNSKFKESPVTTTKG